MAGLRVLIADDSALYRRILATAVEAASPGAQITMVNDGLEVIQKLRLASFDALLMDVNMPGKDGLETLSEIRPRYPGLPVIIISGVSTKAADLTLQALERGALDFIAKPQGGKFEENMEQIIRPLSALFRQISLHAVHTGFTPKQTTSSLREANALRPTTLRPSTPNASVLATSRIPPLTTLTPPTLPSVEAASSRPVRSTRIDGVDIVLIASSTGGPAALERVIFPLPATFDKPILIVQHMPAGFTKALAEKMNTRSAIRVVEAADGVPIRPGIAFIAPGGSHMVLARSKLLRLEQSEHVNGVRPAADVLFRSVAREHKGIKVLCVVLTGMGSDGTAGVDEMKRNCTCYSITQSEASCVVYGMPKSVYDARLSDETVELDKVAKRIVEISQHGTASIR